jgi:hypothetical protein
MHTIGLQGLFRFDESSLRGFEGHACFELRPVCTAPDMSIEQEG